MIDLAQETCMAQTTILLIDDHAMFRTGLRMIIESDLPEVEIYEAGSLHEVIYGSANVPAVAFTPDIALLDLNLPDNKSRSGLNGLGGLDGIALLNKKWPKTAVLVLSSQDDQETVNAVLQCGSTGFVSKAESAKTIVERIRQTLREHGALEWTGLPHVIQPQQITQRQREVLLLLSQGLSNKLIARQLQLSENTVRVHVQALLKFYHATSRAEVVFMARQQNHVD